LRALEWAPEHSLPADQRRSLARSQFTCRHPVGWADRDFGVAAPNATFRTATHLATVEVIDDLLIGVSKDQPKVSGTMKIFYANGFTIFTPALLKSLTLRVATVMS
jgi:hypothetical protein